MPAPTGDAGTGLVSTIGGVTAFLAFLLLATQILLGLHTTSTTTRAHRANPPATSMPTRTWDGSRPRPSRVSRAAPSAAASAPAGSVAST